MMKSDRLQLIFAHIDEPVPAAFLDYAKPQQDTDRPLNQRQIQKWKSRRLAYFLLHRFCEENHLPLPSPQTLLRKENGRPYLNYPDVDFNISHSGDWVTIIFSRSPNKQAVGIDIECAKKIRPYTKLLRYYASAEEAADIQQNHYLPQLTSLSCRFYLSWCLREAVLKAQGVGIIKLSEVRHSMRSQTITSAYCPKGRLFFYHTLPFYLACFIEQAQSSCQMPDIFQWKAGRLNRVNTTEYITYQVN